MDEDCARCGGAMVEKYGSSGGEPYRTIAGEHFLECGDCGFTRILPSQ